MQFGASEHDYYLHNTSYYNPQFPCKLTSNERKKAINKWNGSLWRQPRLGDAPFGAPPHPAFTICGWR